MKARTRGLWLAAGGLLAVWLLAWVGYSLAARAKVTVEKIQAYVNSVDLRRLNERERARAIQRLADMINALSFEERRRARVEGIWRNWFDDMTEAEKGQFIEATMPTGFKKMIAAFEEWPEERRRRAVEEAVRRLREAQRQAPQPSRALSERNPPPLSEELQQRIVAIGLKTFYAESSAQTKAEVAPLLEEMQRMMQSGRFMRGPRGR
ncbi:MAG: hypothetical protein N3I86_02560 [Verrucomicrobiae bacterium]|nr:hypothetical protein [Verrucomicrobiae bacterium]